MNTASQVIAVASGEVGYLEKKSNASLDDKTANAGYNNICKYWRDIYPSFQRQPWCDCFVSWLFLVVFGETVGNRLLCGGLKSFYTPTSAQCYKASGRLDKNPKAGDQIFFSNNGSISGIYHTGIVESFDGTWVTTIEGNTSSSSGVVPNGGGVWRKKYIFNSYKSKMFFGHPLYDEEAKKQTSKAVSYAVQVTASDYLNVRKTPKVENNPSNIYQINGHNYEIVPNQVVAICEETSDGWGRIADIQGWINLKYTKR